MRLLLVEDSVRLRVSIADTLHHGSFVLDAFGTVAESHAALRQIAYGLLIIDLTLPDGDGLKFIRELRSAGCSTPILVITARTAIDDRVIGLESGADDYLVKPFHQAELLARVRALLRRPRDIRSTTVRAGGVVLDEATGDVWINGESFDLRPQERRLLALLLRRAETTVPKSAIEAALSEFDREMSPNAIEVLVCRLRKALSEKPTNIVIDTVRGIGYTLKEVRE
jgi:two-component system, OmpR family, response regulator QseB